MRRRLLLLTIATSIFLSCEHPYKRNNKLLTLKNIICVRPGMTMEKVKSILGEPISEWKSFGYTYCDINKGHYLVDSISYTFDYTNPKDTKYPYPLVWVHFNSRKKVKLIYIKRQSFWDDPGIYCVNNNPCDTTDQIIPIDSTDVQINGLKEFFNDENGY